MRRFVIAAIILFLLLPVYLCAAENLAANGDFEEEYNGMPLFWTNDGWRPEAEATRYYVGQDNPHSGKQYAVIENFSDNDSRFIQKVKVEPLTVYKLSCWIRGKINEQNAVGANITIMQSNFYTYSKIFFDTKGEWEYVDFFVRTAKKQTDMDVCVRVGGYNSTVTGKVDFDDFRLEKVENPGAVYVADITPEVDDSIEGKQNKVLSVFFIIFIILACAGIIVFFIFIFFRKPGTGEAPGEKKIQEPVVEPEIGLLNKTEPEPVKYTKLDLILCCALTLVYTLVAFTHLGGFVAPQTYWRAATKGENLYLDFGVEKNIRKIFYYGGIPNGHVPGNYIIEQSQDAVNWTNVTNINITYQSVFNWASQYMNINARYIRITSEVPFVQLFEIGFLEESSKKPVPVREIKTGNKSSLTLGDPAYLFDEQDTVPERTTMLNGTPSSFDEIYHVRTAFEYLNRIQPYETTHPPFGKILIAAGIVIFGLVPFGWRFMGTLVGVLMVVMMYLFGKRLFKKPEYAFMCAFLMACDFMHFVQTRIATIDSYVVFFIILMYYFMYKYYMLDFYKVEFKKTLIPLLLSGLCWGFAVASKWVGIYGGFGLAVIFFTTVGKRISDYRYNAARLKAKKQKIGKEERAELSWFQAHFPAHLVLTLGWCILVFIVIPVIIYVMSYIPYMMVPGPRHDLKAVWDEQGGMYTYHAVSMKNETHPAVSHWYQWPLIMNLFTYYVGSDLPADKMELIVAMGSPAVWWIGSIAILMLLGVSFFIFYERLNQMGKETEAGITGGKFRAFLNSIQEKDRSRYFILVCAASVYLPWVISPRQLTFIYHFFASVPFIIFATVFLIKEFKESLRGKDPLIVKTGTGLIYFYLAIALLLFIMFYPILAGQIVDRSYVRTFLHWFNNWQFYL